jgi:hypothetical protein
MIEFNVPIRSSAWSGTGTVIVVPAVRFCITMWLPFCRTSTKPFGSILQTSRPERTLSLPNLHLEPGDENFRMPSLLNLARVGSFKKQLDRFLEIIPGRFNRLSLTRYIKFGTERNVSVTFALNDCRELDLFHASPF